MWRSLPCSRCLLRRRLRHPQPRMCSRGSGVDEGGDDQARANAQRGQDLAERCPSGALHIPWLFVWPALSVQVACPSMDQCEPLEEKRARLKTSVRELLVMIP